MDIELQTFCKQLPKLELHAHLNGSLSIETMQELEDMRKTEKKGDGLLGSHLNSVISHGDARTLDECFELFKIAHALTSTPAAVQKATQKVIEDFVQDGVIYLELRSTPRCVSGVMTKTQYIEAIINGIVEAQKKNNIIVKVLLSIDRKQGVKIAEENLNLLMSFNKTHPNIFTGLDLSGDPLQGDINEYLPLLEKTRQNGMRLSIHCAEVPRESETQIILNFKPARIGHGTCIHPITGGTPELWSNLLQSKVPVETCLTSNVKTKTVLNYKSHHFKHMFEARHPVTLATDDKGIFNTSLSEEFLIASRTFDLSRQQLWQLSYDSVDYTFASEEEKIYLKQILTKWKENHVT